MPITEYYQGKPISEYSDSWKPLSNLPVGQKGFRNYRGDRVIFTRGTAQDGKPGKVVAEFYAEYSDVPERFDSNRALGIGLRERYLAPIRHTGRIAKQVR